MSVFTPLVIIFILLLNYYLYKKNSYSKNFFYTPNKPFLFRLFILTFLSWWIQYKPLLSINLIKKERLSHKR